VRSGLWTGPGGQEAGDDEPDDGFGAWIGLDVAPELPELPEPEPPESELVELDELELSPDEELAGVLELLDDRLSVR